MKKPISNTAIIVDSACDLPEDFLLEHDVFVLPIGFEIGGKRFRDRRVPEMVTAFNGRSDVDPAAVVRTEPPSADAIRNFIITEIVDQFENLLILTISSTRSKIYENALQATDTLQTALLDSHTVTPVKLKNIEVVDSRSVFSGQALLAYFAADLSPTRTQTGLRLPKLASLLRNYTNTVFTYVIPNDLAYLKNRGRQRNEKSIGLMDYCVAQVFGLRPLIKWQHGNSGKVAVRRGFNRTFNEMVVVVKSAIDQGLRAKVVMISYSGDVEQIEQSEQYQELVEYARSREVKVFLSTMSITATVYLGPGAISLSFCQ